MECCMTNQFSNSIYPQSMYTNSSLQGYAGMKSEKRGPSTFGMMTLGALGGGTAGYLLNRYPVNNKIVCDEFAQNAFNKHVKKNLSVEKKEAFMQISTILKKIDKTKNAEDLKKLIKNNPKAIELDRVGMTMDTYLSTINNDNFNNIKSAIKQDLEKTNKYFIEKFKLITASCWDNTAKKFIQPKGMQDNVFAVIKKTTTARQWRKALKYGGITAGILGALTVGYKMLVSSK